MMFSKPLADLVTLIPPIHDRVRKGMGLGNPLKHQFKDGSIMPLTGTDDDRDGGVFVYTTDLDFSTDAKSCVSSVNPPQERPNACACCPPFFLRPQQRVDGRVRWYCQ